MSSIVYPKDRHNGRSLLNPRIEWPEGKQFAFTIFDDPDFQTTSGVDPVYTYLSDFGFRTTKSVWPVQGNGTPTVGGTTCEDPRICHGSSVCRQGDLRLASTMLRDHTSTRRETADGLERFFRLFGHYPHTMANHTGCRESIYWGRATFWAFTVSS